MSDAAAAGLGVDVIISNHNYGTFVGDAIESALGQSHPRVRVIVVDDGSTDDSRERIRAYEDRAEVILKPNGGQASAINAGMEHSEGVAVIFLDADDVLRPQVAAMVSERFAAQPDLARVQFPMAFTNAEGQPTGEVKPSGHLRAPTGDMRRAELAFPFDIPWLPGGGTAFSAAAIRRILPIPEGDYPRHGADWYLVHLAALLGPAAALDTVGAEYRVHGGNAYEPQDDRIDLDHVRDSIVFARATIASLEALADELEVPRPQRILSISDLSNRLISLRLDPARHPRPDDSRGSIVADAVRAARRRFDVSAPMKVVIVIWFAIAAVAPRPAVSRLAILLLFPGARRSILNRVLGRWRRDDAESQAGAPEP